jgi:predicted AAA+ superfamily ATPase
MAGVSETLAGRIAVFHLYPLSFWELNRHSPISRPDEGTIADYLLKGFYPEHYSNPSLDRKLWFSSYISTYIERDIRSIRHVSDLGIFQRFVMLLAARTGSLLNLSEISRECGVTMPTAKSWLSLLESTYVVRLLQPYTANLTKRLVKSPKLYFVDTGLLCSLIGVDAREQILRIAETGRLFENLVIMEWVKRSMAESGTAPFTFYRTTAGVEVDLVTAGLERRTAMEIKWSKTVNHRMGAGLRNFRKTFPGSDCILACLQQEPMPLGEGVWSRHWWDALDWKQNKHAHAGA